MPEGIRCLLWDFGDTLCDERFIWESGPDWMEVYRTFDDGWAGAWSLGEMDMAAFAAELSRRIELPQERILQHLRTRCSHIRFFPYTFAFFRAHHLPQAIVTVNPDLFSDVIVPLHGLDEAADVIVTSWQERTADKGRLCELALARLGIDCAPHQAVLIDNRRDCLAAWAARGGACHLFTSDEAFRRATAHGVGGLLREGLAE